MSKSDTYTDDQELTEAQRRKRSKEAYEAVIRTTDYNSGRKQPPLAKQSSIIGTMHGSGFGDFTLEETQREIVAACERGDLFRTRVNGRTRIGINDIDTLRDKIGSCLEHQSDPPRAVIAAANRRIKHLKEGGRDE